MNVKVTNNETKHQYIIHSNVVSEIVEKAFYKDFHRENYNMFGLVIIIIFNI